MNARRWDVHWAPEPTARQRWKWIYRAQRIAAREVQKAIVDALMTGEGFLPSGVRVSFPPPAGSGLGFILSAEDMVIPIK